jgi:uncharacterized tellurite resistance protein B-like protein
MGLRRFLGLKGTASGHDDGSAPAAGTRATGSDPSAETATVRRIVAQLSALPPDQSRYLAGFAYILSRAAQADLDISDEETALMERFVVEHGRLPEAQAILAVEIAKSQSRLYGGTEDYLVTREFLKVSTDEQRLALLRCCFAVGAADDTITAEENAEIRQIAYELGIGRDELNAVANEYRDQLSVLQSMRRARSETADVAPAGEPAATTGEPPGVQLGESAGATEGPEPQG